MRSARTAGGSALKCSTLSKWTTGLKQATTGDIFKEKGTNMFNATVLLLWILIAILSVFTKPWVAAIILFILFVFLSIKIFKNQCRLLLDKNDCTIWDIYSVKEGDFWKDTLWNGIKTEGKQDADI